MTQWPKGGLPHGEHPYDYGYGESGPAIYECPDCGATQPEPGRCGRCPGVTRRAPETTDRSRLAVTYGGVSFVLFVATVWLANWLIQRYGPVPVGFGLMAPAGVYVVGAAFLLRDIVHRTLGRWWVVAAILTGAALAYTVSPKFAFASAVAFLFSELADMVVYTPLAERHIVGAVTLSNTVGAVVDSLIFLTLAFGSLAFLNGQIVGKLWVTAAAAPFVFLARRTLEPAAA